MKGAGVDNLERNAETERLLELLKKAEKASAESERISWEIVLLNMPLIMSGIRSATSTFRLRSVFLAFGDVLQEASIIICRRLARNGFPKDVAISTYFNNAGRWLCIRVMHKHEKQSLVSPWQASVVARKVRSEAGFLSGKKCSQKEVKAELGWSIRRISIALQPYCLRESGAPMHFAAMASLRKGSSASYGFWQTVTEQSILPNEDPPPMISESASQALAEVIESIPLREKFVLSALYGQKPETLDRIGVLIGLTRARVGAIRQNALNRIVFRLRARGFGILEECFDDT